MASQHKPFRLLASSLPYVIEGREEFPGLVFDYGMSVVETRTSDDQRGESSEPGPGDDRPMSYLEHLEELQFVYPEPADPTARHGTCAHVWFAHRGDWTYALEPTQRNAFVPHAFPEWLRMLSHKVSASSLLTQLKDGGFHCCLVSHGMESSWTFDEDPWHPTGAAVADFFIGPEDVCITMSNEGRTSGFNLEPAKGSVLTWRGEGWTMSARSAKPFFRLSFRVIHHLSMSAQRRLKYPHRRAQALLAEQRVVPGHLTFDQLNELIERGRPDIDPLARGLAQRYMTIEPATKKRAVTTPKVAGPTPMVEDPFAQLPPGAVKPKAKKAPTRK